MMNLTSQSSSFFVSSNLKKSLSAAECSERMILNLRRSLSMCASLYVMQSRLRRIKNGHFGGKMKMDQKCYKGNVQSI